MCPVLQIEVRLRHGPGVYFIPFFKWGILSLWSVYPVFFSSWVEFIIPCGMWQELMIDILMHKF